MIGSFYTAVILPLGWKIAFTLIKIAIIGFALGFADQSKAVDEMTDHSFWQGVTPLSLFLDYFLGIMVSLLLGVVLHCEAVERSAVENTAAKCKAQVLDILNASYDAFVWVDASQEVHASPGDSCAKLQALLGVRSIVGRSLVDFCASADDGTILKRYLADGNPQYPCRLSLRGVESLLNVEAYVTPAMSESHAGWRLVALRVLSQEERGRYTSRFSKERIPEHGKVVTRAAISSGVL
jgi:hypothetical protein